jgi:hypothetical protein
VAGRTNRRSATPATFIRIQKCAVKSVYLGLGLDNLKNVRDAVSYYNPDVATSFGHRYHLGLVATNAIATAHVERSFVPAVVWNP